MAHSVGTISHVVNGPFRPGDAAHAAPSQACDEQLPSARRTSLLGISSLIRRVLRQMNRYFADSRLGAGSEPLADTSVVTTFRTQAWLPHVDLQQRERRVVITVDLPGTSADDIMIELRDGALLLNGERHLAAAPVRADGNYPQRSYGAFMRVIPVPRGVRDGDMSFALQHEVLEISVAMPATTRTTATKTAPLLPNKIVRH
jgi:HSP20 family molecular chaperone IbpA